MWRRSNGAGREDARPPPPPESATFQGWTEPISSADHHLPHTEGDMAATALVVIGVILVMFGILSQINRSNVEQSVWVIGLGIVALVAAGALQLQARRH